MNTGELYRTPNALAPYYSEFRVTERILLSGHSHQAWPDVALAAQQQAWLDAARYVDDKWGPAFEQADAIRRGYARLLGDSADRIALGPNTHELLVKFLSAIDLRNKPRIVTTAGEFHSLRRQLDRLSEEGIEVVKVPIEPVGQIAARLVAAIDDRTASVMASAVLYASARIVPGLAEVAAACDARDVPFLVDAYHALNVMPFDLAAEGLESAFVTGAGYKYCQLGEGNGFLRLPDGCALRPVVTGWFSEFAKLSARQPGEKVDYGAGVERFAGATYDPTSNYRGAAVFQFFLDQQLTPELLREVSQHQVGRLIEEFDRQDLDPALIGRDRTTPLQGLGGFLALESPAAGKLNTALKDRGVWTDYRDTILRLGPAPYLSDQQLSDGIAALAEAVKELPVASQIER